MPPTDFVRHCYADAFGYVRADAGVFALLVAAMALPQILADASLDTHDAGRVAGVLGMVQLYVNLLVTFRTLDHAGAGPPGYRRADLTEARYPSAFLMSLASALAILIGLLLLIVPGVLLFLLWSLALPALAAERARGFASLRISWRLARPALGRLALVVVPLGLALAVVILCFAALAMAAPDATLLASILPNVMISAVLPFMASVWTIAYLTLRGGAGAA